MTANSYRGMGIALLALTPVVLAGMIAFSDYGFGTVNLLIVTIGGGVTSLHRSRQLRGSADHR